MNQKHDLNDDDDVDSQNYTPTKDQDNSSRKTNRQILGLHDIGGLSMVSDGCGGEPVELAACRSEMNQPVAFAATNVGSITIMMEQVTRQLDGGEMASGQSIANFAKAANSCKKQEQVNQTFSSSSNSMAPMDLTSTTTTNENGQLIEYNGQLDLIAEPASGHWPPQGSGSSGGGAVAICGAGGSDFDGQKEEETVEVKVAKAKHDDHGRNDAKVDHNSNTNNSDNNVGQRLAMDGNSALIATHDEQAESHLSSSPSSFVTESSESPVEAMKSAPSNATATSKSANGDDMNEQMKLDAKMSTLDQVEEKLQLEAGEKSQNSNLQAINHHHQQVDGSFNAENNPPSKITGTFRRLPVAPSGGARIAVPVARRVQQQQQTKQQASRQWANYLRVRSKSSLDQSSSLPRRTMAHGGSSSKLSACVKQQQVDGSLSSKNHMARYSTNPPPPGSISQEPSRPQVAAIGSCTVGGSLLSLAKAIGAGGNFGHLANGAGGGSTKSLSNRSYSSMGFVTQIPTLISQSHAASSGHNQRHNPTTKVAPIGTSSAANRNSLVASNSSAAAPKIPIMIHQAAGPAKKPQTTGGGSHACSIPKLCGSKSMSNLALCLANDHSQQANHHDHQAAVDRLGAKDDDRKLGAPPAGSLSVKKQQQPMMIGGSFSILNAPSTNDDDHGDHGSANTIAMDGGQDGADGLVGSLGNLAANRDRMIYRSSYSLLPKASTKPLKGSGAQLKFSKSMNCVSIMADGDGDYNNDEAEAEADADDQESESRAKGTPLSETPRVDRDHKQQQLSASQVDRVVVVGAASADGANNNNDQQVASSSPASAPECNQCKLFQSDLESLIREKKQLNEQISELEELENDSRLMSQNLSQQLATLEQQLVDCKLKLEKMCQSEAKLQFQNKKLNFELMQRLESIQQLQCQLTKLQTVRALNANANANLNSNCATTNTIGGSTNERVSSIRNDANVDAAQGSRIDEKLIVGGDGSSNSNNGVVVADESNRGADLTRNKTPELHRETKLMLAKSRDHQRQQQVANLGQGGQVISTSCSSQQQADSNNSSSVFHSLTSNSLEEEDNHSAMFKFAGDIGEQANVSPDNNSDRSLSLGQEVAHLNDPSAAAAASSGPLSLQSQQSGEADSGLSSFKEAVARHNLHHQDALKTGEDSAYSKSSASSDDGNRSDSDQTTSGSPSVEPIVRSNPSEPSSSLFNEHQPELQAPQKQLSATVLVSSTKPARAHMSSSSSGDESDHHESAALGFCLTTSGSAGSTTNSFATCSLAISSSSSSHVLNNLISGTNDQHQQQQQMAQTLTGRQQVLRKKISMARILRGIQVQQSQAQTTTSIGSNQTAASTMNKSTHHQHSRQLDVINSVVPGGYSQVVKPLVGQARLAQVLSPDPSGCNDRDRQELLPLMEDKNRILQHRSNLQTEPNQLSNNNNNNNNNLHQRQQEFIKQQQQQQLASKSPIDLALGGVYDLEQGRADEHLRSLTESKDDGCSLEQVAMGQIKTNTATTLASNCNWAQAKASGGQQVALKSQQQHQGAEMANLINQFKLEIASLKTRLLQAHTLNDNLVSELKSNKNRADELETHLNGFQQQHFNQKASTFVGRQQVSSTMGSAAASFSLEHHHQHPHQHRNSQVDMLDGSANSSAGQRSIIYVNGVRATLSQQHQHHHQAHITSTTTGTAAAASSYQASAHYNGRCNVAGHQYLSGNNDNNNFNNPLQTACDNSGGGGGLNEFSEFLKFLLDKIHFHHGRTFELVNECQKLAMQALLASHSHQLNLIHHNGVVMAGNQATTRRVQRPELAAGQQSQQQQQQQQQQQSSVVELYPVRPPPRRRTAASRMILASGELGLASSSSSETVDEVAELQKQQPPKVGSSGRGSTSALQVAKQTLFSIVPIYYYNGNNNNNNNNNSKKNCNNNKEAQATSGGQQSSKRQAAAATNLDNAKSENNQPTPVAASLQAEGLAASPKQQQQSSIYRLSNPSKWLVLNPSGCGRGQGRASNQPEASQHDYANHEKANNVNMQPNTNVSLLEINNRTSDQNHDTKQASNINHIDQQSLCQNYSTATSTTTTSTSQTAHLIRMKNSLNEDIERYRVRFNGQLLDLLTRQNWCENIITEKLKSYQSQGNDGQARHHHHHHHHQQQQQQLTRPISAATMKGNEQNRIQMNDCSFASNKHLQHNSANMTKSVNVPINSISLNPDGSILAQQQQSYNHRQSWLGNRGDHQVTTSSFC